MAQRYEQQNLAESASRSGEVIYKHPEPKMLPKSIKDLRYPLAPTEKSELEEFERVNMHYVKFYINVDEESSIIKNKGSNGVTDLGYIDNTDQNRANRGLAFQSNVLNNSADKLKEIKEEGVSTTTPAVGTAQALVAARNSAKDKMVKFLAKAPIVAAGATVASVIANPDILKEISTMGGEVADALALRKRLKRLGHTISLYTPAGIGTSYAMDYEVTEAHLANMAQSDTMDSVIKGVQSFGKDPISAAAKMGRILGSAGNSDMSILSRTAMNTRKDMLFKAVGNRSFTFDYQFAPRNPEEAKEVEHIIYLFKYFSHPEVIEGFGQFLFSYPAEFDIEYFLIDPDGNHKVNPYLNRISSCVLERMNVAYAPNGSYQSLLNGEPLIINMSLQFKEIEVLHRGRIEKGF